MNPTHEAVALLQRYARKYPNAWSELDAMRSPELRRDQRIPDEVYSPIGASIAVVTRGAPFARAQQMLLRDHELLRDAAVLSALHAWRQTKGIYRFDPAMLTTIASSDLSKGIPSQLLSRLPEWCVYVETPGFELLGEISGFFAWFDVDKLMNTTPHQPHALELRILTVGTEGDLGIYPLPLRGTIAEGLEAMNASSQHQQAQAGLDPEEAQSVRVEIAQGLEPLIALLLYLCSEAPDISNAQGKQPHKPAPVRVKGGVRHFAPNVETVYTVASSLAKQLDQALAAKTSTSGAREPVRPHVRRAHFHIYLTGKGRSERVLRWIAPTLIGVRPGQVINATTIHTFKNG